MTRFFALLGISLSIVSYGESHARRRDSESYRRPMSLPSAVEVDPEPPQKEDPFTFESIKALFDSAPAKPGIALEKWQGSLEGTCVRREKGGPDRSDLTFAQFLKVTVPTGMTKGNRINNRSILTWKNAVWVARAELKLNAAKKSWMSEDSDYQYRFLDRDRPYVLVHEAFTSGERFCIYTKSGK